MLIHAPYRPRSVPLAISAPALWTWFLDHVDVAALRSACQAFVVSRVVLVMATYLTIALQLSIARHPQLTASSFWSAWYQWDARWYLGIARSGYQWHDLHHFASVAFFPLYPIMIALLLLAAPIPGKLAAIVVANAAFLLALFFLDRLVRRECGAAVAARTTLYLSLFPTALFFFAGYTESPFLLWSVLSILAMRQRRWVWAGFWGGLASATHATGIALMVPFAVEWYQAHGLSLRWLLRRDARMAGAGLSRHALARGAWIGLIPAGCGAFALYLGVRFGDPLLFDQIQRAWHRTITWPWTGLAQTLRDISPSQLASYAVAHNLVELLTVIAFTLLIVAGWGRLPRSFSLYTAAFLLLTLMTPAALDGYYIPLRSTSRFCLALFPCFITLGMLGNRPAFDRLYLALSPAALAIFTAVFLQGGWVA